MEPKDRITPIKNQADLPNIDEIAELSRGINWKFIFDAAILSEREEIGEEFGELDPYFFSGYILSTPQYVPIPVAIFSPHGDGHRIVKVMQQLGKFEEISSNIPGRTGVIVTDREKKKVVVSEEGFQSILQQVTTKSPLSSIWYRFMQFWKK